MHSFKLQLQIAKLKLNCRIELCSMTPSKIYTFCNTLKSTLEHSNLKQFRNISSLLFAHGCQDTDCGSQNVA